ncbi:MAG TPA: sigma 54-interacting transcriptional regulator [Bacteroidales bacterium]|nr:sigma 54-interacting transcriptional regulator [Bacteroidales bacterium]
MKNQTWLPLMTESPCGMVIADRDLTITFWNREMLRLTGIDADTAAGEKLSLLKFYDIRHSDKKPLDFKQCLVGEKANIAKTVFLEGRDDKQTLVFINAKFINTGASQELFILITDISREIACSTVSAAPLIVQEKEPLQKIVGHDEKIYELYRMIELAADSMAIVNIYGESGTGKELIANAIHQLSPRKNKPFIKVNCSALTETLLESELFGHVKGSFTGAYKDKAGRFEAAGGGTVFLDEIGEISQMIQVKLLRVIQEKTIERVGDNKPVKVDMRIITATNKNLRELVNKGLFREDLFYRLNVFPIFTTPLRNRMNDIPLLVEYFISRFNKYTGKHIQGLTENAYRVIMDYCWPGNVRELENSIEHAFVVCNKKLIDVFDLPQELRVSSVRRELCVKMNPPDSAPANIVPENVTLTGQDSFRYITREQLQHALARNKFSRKNTAKQLGVSTVALWKKMKKFGMGG